MSESTAPGLMNRRRLLSGASAALVAASLPGCAAIGFQRGQSGAKLVPYLPSVDRISHITVCSRPFRAAGPRLEVERMGEQSIVHSYGHGGSGWSLSWGSGEIVTQLALATGERHIGVVGCGAVGLTAAVQLQRAGAQVTIYARELAPDVASSFATGVWSPSSRIGLEGSLTPAFLQRWQKMTRQSWRMYQNLLGLPGAPVEFVESYGLSDTAPSSSQKSPRPDARAHFAELERELVPEIGTRSVPVDAAATPFSAPYVRRGSQLMFNLPAYSRLLLSDFRAGGGRLVIDELRTPSDFARLPHKTVVNATGIGARELLGDRSLIPVRGQLAHMVPQAEVRYGLQYHKVGMVPRRDGFVLQVYGEDEYYGYENPGRTPDMAEAELAVNTIASAFRQKAA